jgi:hypothetical protein
MATPPGGGAVLGSRADSSIRWSDQIAGNSGAVDTFNQRYIRFRVRSKRKSMVGSHGLGGVITISTPTGSVLVTKIAQDTDHSAAWNLRGKRSEMAMLLPGLLPNSKVNCDTIVLVQIVVVTHRPVLSGGGSLG